MRDYRDELQAAHVRIQQLEEDAEEAERILRERRPPPKWKGAMLGLGVAIGLAVGASGIAIFGRWLDRVVDTTPPQPLPPSPPPPPAEARLEAMHRVPELVDVDGDGTADLVELFVGVSDDHLRVRAIDGATWKTLWTAGPYDAPASMAQTSAQHMAIVRDRAVVADGLGRVHVLALANGKELTTHYVPQSVESCIAETAGTQAGPRGSDGSFRIKNLEARPTEVLVPTREARGAGKIIDVIGGGERDAPDPSWCFAAEIGTPGVGCARDDSDECARYLDPPMHVADFQPYQTWFESDKRVTVGNGGSHDAIGWMKGASHVTWQHSLIVQGDEAMGYTKNAIGDGRFVSAYSTNDGHGHVVARAVQSGDVSWQMTLSGPDTDPYPVAMGVTKGRVLLVTRSGALFVLDATSGAQLFTMGGH
jgi:outer membrane protein assembly factor BamB